MRDRRKPPPSRTEPRPRTPRAADEPGAPPGTQRVQRILAQAGYGSRRGSEDLIRLGRVAVNGRPVTLGDRADPAVDRITVDGVPVPAHPGLRFYALHKPAGVTTTMRDPHASRSLASFMPRGPRVFPVGRLDAPSEGLLLLTNDGDLAHRLQHPRYGVEKAYVAEVKGAISREALRLLTRGVELDDGVARAAGVGRVLRRRDRSSLEIVMTEGRKREVRRMLEAVGFPVSRLIRVRFGPIRLGDLPPGKARPLHGDEVAALYQLVGLDRAAPRRRRGDGHAKAASRRTSSRGRATEASSERQNST